MEHRSQIVTDAETLHKVLAQAPMVMAADCETYGTNPAGEGARLLGLSLSWQLPDNQASSCYIPFWVYAKGQWRFEALGGRVSEIAELLKSKQLIGWNATYDKAWLDATFGPIYGVTTNWKADGRILWHLSTTDESIRGFGLKLAQKKLLGWTETNDEALERNVRAKGGRLSNGDHYLADLPVLAHYAQLDTLSTLMAYNKLAPYFDEHNYWDIANRILHYSFLLKSATDFGIRCDLEKLKEARTFYAAARLQSEESLRAECATELRAIETGWRTEKVRSYKKASAANAFLSSPDKWDRFNPGSAQQRAHLLHNVLKFPVLERTKKTQQPKTSRDLIENIDHPAAKHLAAYSENKKNLETTETYINAWRAGRLHPGYDVCGTVSGRLGGFVPYLLAAPFSEPRIMGCFEVEPGYVGVHSDLTAIEPTITACYSLDPNLLKVYRDGKGDIYLDLALDLFPDRDALRRDYDPFGPAPSAAVKERHKKLRNVCKIVHLAVSYGGSYFTVAKNLNKAGFPTTEAEARILVNRYWRKFAAVKDFAKRLRAVYLEQGSIRNLTGRIIHVDPRFIKDLLNRLIQSSGHDILVLWVTRITEALTAEGIAWLPLLPDVHDSITVQVPVVDKERTLQIFQSTLDTLNADLQLGVTIRCETKTCTTLGGLKGSD